ncbi:SDR family NAD(P)-dependent oxidoreductase [Phenylobacterium sp.]|jgi:NAD(P)-dependent dehydrogenase (short-subunit alcohol dehydrogenase family)|uniref:SDR family NAD(P)-dependent oxidoreductase n=1 Tax=Phenylobacterium sp. TaxID=1871053 RepID=UPI002F40A52F
MAQRPLEGRVAVVAGASRGVGMGCAVELGAAGAFVYALGRTLKPGTGDAKGSLTETVEQIEQLGGRGVAVACDCTDEQALADILARVKAEQGRLDVIVNSVFAAPRFGAAIGKRFWETSTDLWREVVDLGAKSAYLASYYAAPLMIDTAGRDRRPTLIVNVSGRGAVRYRYNVVYGVGKSATERLTRDMALDLKDHNVAVTSIWPNGHTVPPAEPETPRYNGRGVVALAADPKIMDKSGAHFWTAELAREYGFTDELGHAHPIADLTDTFSLDQA